MRFRLSFPWLDGGPPTRVRGEPGESFVKTVFGLMYNTKSRNNLKLGGEKTEIFRQKGNKLGVKAGRTL